MKILLDILMHIMSIIVVTDHMQGLVKPAISFLAQSHQEVQKKELSKQIYPPRGINPRSNLLSVYSQISQILDQTPSSVTCPLVIEGP